jgi:hypothetical protein
MNDGIVLSLQVFRHDEDVVRMDRVTGQVVRDVAGIPGGREGSNVAG